MHKLACECSAAALRCRLSQASSLLGGMSMLIYFVFIVCVTVFHCSMSCVGCFFTMQLCVSTNKFYNYNYNWPGLIGSGDRLGFAEFAA